MFTHTLPSTHHHVTPATHQAASSGVSATTVVIVVAVILVIGLLIWNAKARKFAKPFWRFFSGELILRRMGQYDSTWRFPAPPPPQGGILHSVVIPRTRWARLPGYQRMLWRWLLVGVLLLAWQAPFWALVTAGVALLVGLALSVRKVREEWRDFWILRVCGRWVEQAAEHLGQDPDSPREWIACPKPRLDWDPIVWPQWLLARIESREKLVKFLYSIKLPVCRLPLDEDEARIDIHYPLALEVTEANKAGTIAKTRLDGDWEVHNDGKKAIVSLLHPVRPPKYVEYDATLNAAYDEHNLPIGLGKPTKGKDGKVYPNPIVIPVKDLTPHVVLSATTGWCKTSTTNMVLAHVLSKGAFALLNDPKRVGYVAAFGNLADMVRLATTVDAMIENYRAFRAEMERRYQLIERFPEIKAAPELYFRQWWLVEDEKGSLTSMIKAAHKKSGGEDGGPGKGMPEALEDLKIILWQARAANMHVWTAAQQANLDVFIDSDGRDQYMARIASGPQTSSAYRMMFTGTRKKVPAKKGRALISLGVDDPQQFQLAAINDESAREFAQMGNAILADQERERAERLERVVSGVSTPGAEVPGSADTAANVPGTRGDGQVPAEADNEVTREVLTGTQMRKFSVIAGSGSEITISRNNASLFSITNPAEDDNSSEPEVTVPRQQQRDVATVLSGAEDSAEQSDTEPETAAESDAVVGNPAAAELLGMSVDAFTKARTRHKKRNGGEDLPGTTTRADGVPVFSRSALAEWHNQRPRAGSNAVGE